jgi:hypothetical protein
MQPLQCSLHVLQLCCGDPYAAATIRLLPRLLLLLLWLWRVCAAAGLLPPLLLPRLLLQFFSVWHILYYSMLWFRLPYLLLFSI